MKTNDSVIAIDWQQDRLLLLDQRLLPDEVVWLEINDCRSAADSIQNMVVRGAPAIGITAAYAIAMAARFHYKENPDNWQATIAPDLERLRHARPTAVNLAWAVTRMQGLFESISDDPYEPLLLEAKSIHQQDVDANRRMGEQGANLIQPGKSVLTHCNAGSLATGGYGTALGVIRSAWNNQLIDAVYADETRPWLQGARLTAWELIEDGIPTTMVIEGAASALMASGKIGWVIVGSDRIAANGDVCNKIGTLNLAIIARHYGVKFMVVAPLSTCDAGMMTGQDIPIEMRDSSEVLCIAGKRVAATAATAWNPVFDITPANLIDAIVTEKSVVMQPNTENMRVLWE